MTADITINALSGSPFGAEVTGLDPSAITAAQRTAIWDAYRQYHGLLCFSFGRLLEADELHALTAVFGENEYAPGRIHGIGKRATDGQQHLSVEEQAARIKARGEDPYLIVLGSRQLDTGKPKPVDDKYYGEWEWHTDMSYIEVPPTFSLLHSREIPDDGADTGFCSQVLAARALPPALRERVLEVRIKHDSTFGSSGKLRPGMTPPASPIEALGHAHPVIRIVPDTGDEALFLGRRTNAYVPGLPLEESEVLLDELWAHATRPGFCYRHRWQAGQVVAWDNRMLLHMRYPMDANKTRIMWRTQTRGEPVVPAGT